MALSFGRSAAKAATAKKRPAGGAAPRILPAPKGPRKITHKRIKAAVDKVFRERAEAHG